MTRRPARLLALAAALTIVGPGLRPLAEAPPLPEPRAFFDKVRERIRPDGELLRNYLYTETRRRQQVNSEGRVVDESTEVYEIRPGPEPGETWRLKVAIDGEPLPEEDIERQKRELMVERARERLERSRERPEQRERRQAEAAREQAERLEDLFSVYEFRIVGRGVLDGHPVIEVDIRPRPDAQPRTDFGRLMRSFAGRAWISETEYEVVRVRMKAIEGISRGFGLIARLHEGARVEALRQRTDEGVWLPARVRFSGSGRIALVRRFGVDAVTEYSNFQPLGSAQPGS